MAGPVFRFLRHDERGAATIVGFIAAAAVFVLATATLLHFVGQSPGADQGLVEQDLKDKADGALRVMLGSPGFPADWATSPAKVDQMNRLGLLESGASIRLSTQKFDALAKGRFVGTSPTNGVVDYNEARKALGLAGFDMHLRSQPALAAFTAGSYGIEGMDEFHVGYVGHWSGGTEQEESKSERYALNTLPIDFANATPLVVGGAGDVYMDDSATLRSMLVPLLGSSPAYSVIPNQAAHDHVPRIVNASVYASLFNGATQPSLTKALALVSADAPGTPALSDLGYTKNKDVRTILGSANFGGLATATLTWNEWMDTGAPSGDLEDFGFVEVSPNSGATWYALTNAPGLKSTDTQVDPLPQSSTWSARQVVITNANCSPCMGAAEVLVAFHWTADNDNSMGSGWIVDDVVLQPTSTTGFQKTFERPEYDMIIIGSKVAQAAFTPAEVKNAIRDYVNVYGGRILVLGGETNTNWLEPLFHVGERDASPGVAAPDPTHPLLTVPNELDYTRYGYAGQAWSFTTAADETLFSHVVMTSSSQAILTVSRTGTFGEDGAVMLTTYLPYQMPEDQQWRFFANAITYGRYHHLFIDLGPEVPADTPVASVTRTATMDKTSSGSGEYVEMTFLLYLWRGDTEGAVGGAGSPSAPQSPLATSGDQSVALAWSAPINQGAGSIQGYKVYRGTAPGSLTTYVGSFVTTAHTVTGLTNGQTYYFNVTAVNAVGEGSASSQVSATACTMPSVPLSASAVGGLASAQLTWSSPLTHGGLPIQGYSIYRKSGSDWPLLVNTTGTSYTDVDLDPGATYDYKLSAYSACGEGAMTGVVSTTTLAGPPGPPVGLVVTPGLHKLTLSWSPPNGEDPQTLSGYNIYASSSPTPSTLLATVAKTNVSFDDDELGNGVTRYYRIAAVNGYGESIYSNEASGTTIDVPNAPVLVTVTQAGPNNLTLTWAKPTDLGGGVITVYSIYGSNSAGTESFITTVAYTGAATQTYTQTGLSNNATRYYKVSANTSAGESPLSNELNATSAGVPYPPTLTAVPLVGKKMQLTIVAPANDGGASVVTYKIYRCAGVSCSPTTFLVDTGGALTWQDPGLTTGTSYTYQATAVSAAGEGNKSAAATATSL